MRILQEQFDEFLQEEKERMRLELSRALEVGRLLNVFSVNVLEFTSLSSISLLVCAVLSPFRVLYL